MKSLYQSKTGKKQILELYEKKLKSLDITYSEELIHTSFGKTNVIIVGNSTKPPLIVIHGSNGCAPISLETYPNLHKEFQVFAIDVLAQPNKSAENRLSMKDQSYGQWINEVISTLNLKNVTLVGFSFGGLIILKTLIHSEKNIKQVFLAAPAYIANGSPLRLILKVFIPMKRYMRSRNAKHLNQFLNSLFTAPDAFAFEFLSKVFVSFSMDFSPVPVIKKVDAKSITTPITIFAAKKDIIFPGKKMIKRARKIFPSLKAGILLENSKHVQSKKENDLITQIIMQK